MEINNIVLCCCLVAKSCLTLWDPIDCSPPGSSVHGISQARILEWVAISFFRGSSQPRGGTHISCIARRILYHWTTWETHCPLSLVTRGQVSPRSLPIRLPTAIMYQWLALSHTGFPENITNKAEDNSLKSYWADSQGQRRNWLCLQETCWAEVDTWLTCGFP